MRKHEVEEDDDDDEERDMIDAKIKVNIMPCTHTRTHAREPQLASICPVEEYLTMVLQGLQPFHP